MTEVSLKQNRTAPQIGEFAFCQLQVEQRLNCYIESFSYYHDTIKDAAGATAFNALCLDAGKVVKVFVGNININANVAVGSGKSFAADFFSPDAITPVADVLECFMNVNDVAGSNRLFYNQKDAMVYKITPAIAGALSATDKFSIQLDGYLLYIKQKP